MNSIWKDLLFLHGHIARKEDLVWHDETAAESPTETATEAGASTGDNPAPGGRTTPPKDGLSHWPRMAVPH